MDNTKRLRVLSLCSGMLGIERGIEQCGLKVESIAHVEREAFICFNLAKQMEQGKIYPAPIWTDIKTFDAQPFCDKVHGIIGGYPCQGESQAGLRKLERDERFLWPYIREIVKSIKPVFCFFENVQGHLTGTFKYVLRDLRAMDYAVEAGIYSAAEVGASHQRKRLFILACSDIRALRRCLADSYMFHRSLSEKSKQQKNQTSIESFSKNVGNTLGKGLEKQVCSRFKSIEEKDATQQRSQSSGTTTEDGNVSNANSFRKSESSKEHKTIISEQNGYKWPARPYEQQYEWEAPRTVKPGLGCTIDGYNYRRDLLRMYGNGVVPQSSALAFHELTKLMFGNQLYYKNQ